MRPPMSSLIRMVAEAPVIAVMDRIAAMIKVARTRMTPKTPQPQNSPRFFLTS
jgi:hypothetical protein